LGEAIRQVEVSLASTTAAAPLAARSLRQGLAWLREAERIRVGIPLVPYGDEERQVATLGRHGLGLLAPFPVAAIEYEHSGIYNCREDPTRCLATRRIALAVNMQSERAVQVEGLKDFQREPEDAGALLIWPLTYYDEKNEWAFAPGAAIVPRFQALDVLHATRWQAWRTRVLGSRQDVALQVRYQELLPELIHKLGPEADRLIRESAMDATWVVLGVFAALACRNVDLHGDATKERMPVLWRRGQEMTALDPFHGQPMLGWSGQYQWQQQARAMPAQRSVAEPG
jgi:hypothetical protein